MLQQTPERPLTRTLPALNSSGQDRFWISQTLAGDQEAFGFLVDKYKDRLFDLTCRVLKNRCQGEDVLQDAFLQAYQSLSRFRHDSTFASWLYAIVLNRLRNHLRRNKIIHWSSLDAPRRGQDDNYTPEFPYKESSMDLLMERKLDIEAIQRMVATFPLHYQSIFIMYYFQDLSTAEIANTTRRPLSTVKVYLHRARKLLYSRIGVSHVSK
jgi:RNA polymerase sigma-70 factor (ECF subfamily)